MEAKDIIKFNNFTVEEAIIIVKDLNENNKFRDGGKVNNAIERILDIAEELKETKERLKYLYKSEVVRMYDAYDYVNKKANGEELPKKIEYKNNIYEYEDYDYFCVNRGYFFDRYNVLGMLNEEVEILEEKKK